MGGRRSNNQPNAKKVAGHERKASQIAAKENKLSQQQEEQLAKEWKIGSNVRGAQRRENAALKSDEKARKAQEKIEILREEENLLQKTSGKTVKNTKITKIKGKRNNNNELSILEYSLVSEAQKKLNIQRKKQEKKSQKEKEIIKMKKDEIYTRKKKDEAIVLMENTQHMIDDKSMNTKSRTIDSALKDIENNDTTPPLFANNKKALYKVYEEKMLVELKKKHPGLRLNQYRDKISNMWKKHYEKLEKQNI